MTAEKSIFNSDIKRLVKGNGHWLSRVFAGDHGRELVELIARHYSARQGRAYLSYDRTLGASDGQ
jgi:hypothetical protein